MSLLERTQDIQSKTIKLPTDIYGLKYRPSLEPHISNNEDRVYGFTVTPESHFSSLDHSALEYALNKLTQPPKVIVEIGVDACGGNTSTNTLLRFKSKECMYIGIDIEDKSYLNDSENNVFTIQSDSANRSEVYKLLDSHGHEKIDFIFVDGWHSINQVIEEWKYWEQMAPNAVMAFHDTNYHPGPVAVLDAIDRDIFSVEYFGRGDVDWGVGVVQRLKV